MRAVRRLVGGLGLVLTAAIVLAACSNSDDAERLAAQRLFRNYLVQQDPTMAADVRIQGFVGELPPDFPVADGLTLLGSAFSDTNDQRELIVGWESNDSADDLFEFYAERLDQEPWVIDSDSLVRSIDFIHFSDLDNPGFRGELRIAQEGSDAVVVLIARETVPSEPAPTGS